MASEWEEEADRQAQAITGDLIKVGTRKGFRVTYQKREAGFARKTGALTTLFSAHDYETEKGIDWLQLGIDILTLVKQSPQQHKQDQHT